MGAIKVSQGYFLLKRSLVYMFEKTHKKSISIFGWLLYVIEAIG